jgi:hypothetical protein
MICFSDQWICWRPAGQQFFVLGNVLEVLNGKDNRIINVHLEKENKVFEFVTEMRQSHRFILIQKKSRKERESKKEERKMAKKRVCPFVDLEAKEAGYASSSSYSSECAEKEQQEKKYEKKDAEKKEVEKKDAEKKEVEKKDADDDVSEHMSTGTDRSVHVEQYDRQKWRAVRQKIELLQETVRTDVPPCFAALAINGLQLVIREVEKMKKNFEAEAAKLKEMLAIQEEYETAMAEIEVKKKEKLEKLNATA